MPGLSFGLPAISTCPGKAGTICDSCYAVSGHYMFPKSVAARVARYEFVSQSPDWPDEMIRAIKMDCENPYFRIHDSGDFFSIAYITGWQYVCERLPDFKFWAATRSWNTPCLTPYLVMLNSLPNVTVRPSALNFGDLPPDIPGLASGSMVDQYIDARNTTRGVFSCRNKDFCGTCRVCWDHPEVPVSYHRRNIKTRCRPIAIEDENR